MPNFIIKLTDKKNKVEFYTKWSTIVDAPVSDGLTFEEAKSALAEVFKGEELKEVLTNLETNGTSNPFYTISDIIETNEANCKSMAQLIKHYFNN